MDVGCLQKKKKKSTLSTLVTNDNLIGFLWSFILAYGAHNVIVLIIIIIFIPWNEQKKSGQIITTLSPAAVIQASCERVKTSQAPQIVFQICNKSATVGTISLIGSSSNRKRSVYPDWWGHCFWRLKTHLFAVYKGNLNIIALTPIVMW